MYISYLYLDNHCWHFICYYIYFVYFNWNTSFLHIPLNLSSEFRELFQKIIKLQNQNFWGQKQKDTKSIIPVIPLLLSVVFLIRSHLKSGVWIMDIYIDVVNMLSTVLKYIRRQPTFLLQCRREKKICDNILNWALLKYSLYQSRKVLWLNLRFFTWLYTWRSVTCSISLSISSLEK